jgi:HD-like signal output (HDOD) protein
MTTVQPDSSFASALRDTADALSHDEAECPTFVDASLGARLALKDPNLSVAQVAKIASGEPLLSARVVAYANSAAMNRGGKPVTDVKTAVMRIGQSAVRNIAVALALRQVGHAKELEPFRQQAREVLEHGLEVAVLSNVLALHYGKVAPDDALFAGLVHDLVDAPDASTQESRRDPKQIIARPGGLNEADGRSRPPGFAARPAAGPLRSFQLSFIRGR